MNLKVLFIVYDNGSKINEFPLGIAYLSSALRKAGHTVEIYSQDIYHYPPEHLTHYLDTHNFEMVGLGLIAGYWQFQQFIKLSEAINKSIHRKDFIYVLGGHMFATDPEYFLRKGSADYVVIGEGERTIMELCAVTGHVGMEYLPQVNGIAYLENNRFVKTNPRRLIQDLDSIQFPSWDLFDINHYCLSPFPGLKHTDRIMPVQGGVQIP